MPFNRNRGAALGLIAIIGCARLNTEAVKALQLPDVSSPLAVDAVEVVGSTPEQAIHHIQGEIARWTMVIKGRGDQSRVAAG